MAERIEALRIVTRCKSVAELVTAFEPFVDDDCCFIPNKRARPVGTEIAFSIRLADGTPVLRGAGRVRDMWTDDANPFGRPGMRLKISRIAPQSRALYERLKPSKVQPVVLGYDKTLKTEVVERGVKTEMMEPIAIDFALVNEGRPRVRRVRPRRPMHSTLRGISPLTPPGVPRLMMDSGPSIAVAMPSLIWRWRFGVVAVALVVAMLLLR